MKAVVPDSLLCIQVANYIHQQTAMDFQCIVIFLKEEFYSHADALVGIYAEVCMYVYYDCSILN